jgi:cellulose synthase/poly-beta-1,6-N-acetylglucosamine synthase-like glycosyltransferase
VDELMSDTIENAYKTTGAIAKFKSDIKSGYGLKFSLNNKSIIVIALLSSILITVSVSTLLLTEGNKLNNDVYSHVTILGEPGLLHALQAAQAHGVIMGIHGWEHENYSQLTPDQARANVEKGRAVFKQAGLTSTLFISPFEITGVPNAKAIQEAIESTGVVAIGTKSEPIYEYTWNWRNMKSFNDPRYMAASNDVRNEKPITIVLHAQDWNKYTEQFLVSYLTTTNEKNISIRMDDVGVNTPKEVVNSAAKLTQYKSVGKVIFAVIPSGAYDGNDPAIGDIPVSSIMGIYFLFFIITALLPLAFFVIWKVLSDVNAAYCKKKERTASNFEYPGLVTVIVPAYNEEKSIGRCIEALLNQDYKGTMEIIVVNDGSRDKTAEIVPRYPVKFIDLKKNGGKANALNRAIDEAKGDIIIFSDGDSNMEKGAVSALVEAFLLDSEAQMVTGNVLINEPEKRNLWTYCQMIEYHLEQEIARHLQGLCGKVMVCPGPITAVRRGVCEVVRYSDDTIVEDADYTVNVLKQSMKAIRAPDAYVYTNAPETIHAWYKQRRRWWFGYLQVWNIHKKWGMKSPWMIYNYMSYIISTCSVIMMIALPYLLLQYDNFTFVALRGILYIIIPVLLYIAFTAMFFAKNKKLLWSMIPYIVVYSTFRVVLLSYLYICHLTGKGLNIQFGSRVIKAK